MSSVEKYYSVHELVLLLSVSDATVRRRIKEGSFGTHLVDVGTPSRPSIRVPASAVNAYLCRHDVLTHTQNIFADCGVKARTALELKRKLAKVTDD